MKKKLTSLVLALVMCLTLCVPAFAAEPTVDANSTREAQIAAILKNYDNMNDLNRAIANKESGSSQALLDGVSVACTMYASNLAARRIEIPADVGCAVSVLGSVYDSVTGIQTGTIYAATAVGTERWDTDSEFEDRIQTRVDIVWIDNLGTSNQMLDTNGQWEYETGRQVSDRQVQFGVYGLWGYTEQNETHFPTSNTFNYNAYTDYIGLKFATTASIYSTGYGTVTLRVETSRDD